MNNRQRGVLLQLVTAEDALTSEQLAQRLGVSSRTIKSDMAAMTEELRENGAQLISRRNRGYTLQVEDREKFNALYTMVQLRLDRTSSRDEGERMLYIARKLVATKGGIFVDKLAEELYLSRGGLRTPLRRAVKFCESFHLQVISAPGQGLRVEGEEHLLRLAATELFELHFHTVELTESEENYAKWVACEYQERQDIRHTFLHILRQSAITIRDTDSQRIARYLIIARNRCRGGYHVSLPLRWVREIRTTPVYATAEEVYRVLGESFADYRMDEHEVCLLAILLMLGLHPSMERSPRMTVPYLENTVREAANALFLAVLQATGTDLSAVPDARSMLEGLLLPLAVRVRYGLDGCQTLGNLSENIYFGAPMGVYYARIMAAEAERQLQCHTSMKELVDFACYISTLLWRVEYPIRPMRLVLVDLEESAFGEVVGQALRQRWPEYIESITPMALYEIRKLPETTYDGVLLGYSMRNRALASYRYSAPVIPMAMVYQERSFHQVYDQLLVHAYQMEEVTPKAEAFHIYEDFAYYGVEQVFQLLCARYARDPAGEARLLASLRQWERIYTMARPGMVVICAEAGLCKEERFDIYRLSKAGEWNGVRVDSLVFATVAGTRPEHVKAVGAVLSELVQNPGKLDRFLPDPRAAYIQFLRESVQSTQK